MAKHPQDTKTIDLLPIPAKRGRKPQGDKAMSSSERVAAYRARQKDNPKPSPKALDLSVGDADILIRALDRLFDAGKSGSDFQALIDLQLKLVKFRGHVDRRENDFQPPKNDFQIRYCHNGMTWTGKGRKPQWFIDFIAQGGDPESIEVHH